MVWGAIIVSPSDGDTTKFAKTKPAEKPRFFGRFGFGAPRIRCTNAKAALFEK
jgi:hypothetical protein